MRLFPLTREPPAHWIARADEALRREAEEARLEYVRRQLDADLVVEMSPIVLDLMTDGTEITIEGKRYRYLGAVGVHAVLKAVTT
jgi:hypothetical protein